MLPNVPVLLAEQPDRHQCRRDKQETAERYMQRQVSIMARMDLQPGKRKQAHEDQNWTTPQSAGPPADAGERNFGQRQPGDHFAERAMETHRDRISDEMLASQDRLDSTSREMQTGQELQGGSRAMW
jgi:hypothetical protein